MLKPKKPFRKSGLGFVLGFFIFAHIVIGGTLSRPGHVYAQSAVFDPASAISAIYDAIANVASEIGEILGGVASTVAYQSSMFLLQTLAMDSATALADSASGRKTQFWSQNFGDYLTDTASDGIFDTLNELSKSFLGLDLCQPPDPMASLAIQIGLRNPYRRPEAKCTYEGISDAWDKKWESVKKQYGGCSEGSSECMTAIAKQAFKPSNTELGIAVNAQINLGRKVRVKRQDAIRVREEGDGYKAKTTRSGSYITLPADVSEEEGKNLSGSKQLDRATIITAGQLGSKFQQGLLAIPTIFGTTFATKYLQNKMQDWFRPTPGSKKDLADRLDDIGNLDEGDGGITYNINPAVEVAVNTLAVVDGGQYDILQHFVSCPAEQGGLNRTPDECVIDSKLELAIRQAESGRAMTIKEALGKGLNAHWRLIPPSNVGYNAQLKCRNEAYCYANIAKLRQARILPLGFEIAAEKSPEGAPWSLGQVVDGFNDCNSQGAADDNHPFCHLIDPQWILKAPPARCEAKVPGPMLAISDGNVRHEICVDSVTCLQDDGRGQCNGSWGYCLKEKNIWRTGADSCPEQYTSCTTYEGASAGAQKKVSYLSRTVDFGQCSAEDVGCRGYLTYKQQKADGSFDWPDVVDLLATRLLHLTAKAQDCTEPGCTQFIKQDGSEVYIKKAPAYLGCYDQVDPQEPQKPELNWPQTISDLAQLSPRQECGQYAPVCAAEEAGCSSYAPENGDPAVPAIVADADFCPVQCLGYDTYKQLETDFDTAEFPIHFIPDTAQQCSGAYVGCDQFVNVSSEKFEYYSFVKQCELPNEEGSNAGAFYAWEGSDIQGYQLKSYTLKTTLEIPGGGQWLVEPYPVPAYAAAYDSDLIDSYLAVCNQQLYQDRLADQDCRELFDREGRKFYRLLSHTITVSDQCQLLRKSDADIISLDNNVVDTQNKCEQDAKGVWEDGSCSVCKGGGENNGGLCNYWVLPSEAISCPARESGCRQYTGNAGNNVEEIVRETFGDSGRTFDAQGWDQGEISAEAVTVGGHSWKAQEQTSLVIQAEKDSSYTFSFWVKGVPGNLSLEFEGVEIENVGGDPTVRIANDWQQHTLGPVYFTDITDVLGRATINFELDGVGEDTFFLDNVIVRKTIAHATLIKNSWSTPLACDSNPNDELPGEALGCKAYKADDGARLALKSFANICRAEAVGCERLINTHNSQAAEGKTFNLVCGESYDGDNDDVIDEDSRACYADIDLDGDGSIDDQEPVCTVPFGEKTCLFDMPRAADYDNRATDGAHAGLSTYIVPADSVAYLVNKAQYRCSPDQKGCMELGQVTGQRTDDNKRIVNTVSKRAPVDELENIMCSDPLVGCEAYKVRALSDQSERTVYLKDPVADGQGVCEYKENVAALVGGETIQGARGWFVVDSDPLVPCYPNVRSANHFKLPSQGDANYRPAGARVGVCPDAYNACLEIVDPADSSQIHPDGQPYYVIDNGKLDRTSCNNEASLDQGCVLFDDRSIPAKPYDVDATYIQSSDNNGALVKPVAHEDNEDEYYDCFAPGANCERKQFTSPLLTTALIPSGSYVLTAAGQSCRDGFERRRIVLNNLVASAPQRVVQAEPAPDGPKRVVAANHNPFHEAPGGGAQLNLGDQLDGVDDQVDPDDDPLENNNALEQADGYFCMPLLGANTVIKVVRDRACSEWLACKSEMTVIDQRTNQPTQVCGDVGVCIEHNTSARGSSSCSKWAVNDSDEVRPILSPRLYSQRKTGWYGEDFTGYSFNNKYQVADYRFVRSKGEVGESQTLLVALPYPYATAVEACSGLAENGACAVGPVNGTCIGGLCAVAPDGSKIDLLDPGVAAGQCRGYASAGAPFTFSGSDIDWVDVADGSDAGAKVGQIATAGFGNVSICQRGSACACSYQEVEYGDQISKYFDVDQDVIPKGICSGGFGSGHPDIAASKDGQICRSDADCLDERSELEETELRNGRCLLNSGTTLYRGLEGYCLETDQSITTPGSGVDGKACLTWMPVDTIPGAPSLHSNFQAAGFQIGAPHGVVTTNYCAMSVGNGKPSGDTVGYKYNARDRDIRQYSGRRNPHHHSDFVMEGTLTKSQQLHFSELDYIELDWEQPRHGGEFNSDPPHEGVSRIINDGIETQTESDVLGTLPSKPRIYAKSTEKCWAIAELSGLVLARGQNSERFECIFTNTHDNTRVDDMLDDNGGVITLFARHPGNDRLYGLAVFSDGDTDGDGPNGCGNMPQATDIDCNQYMGVLGHPDFWTGVEGSGSNGSDRNDAGDGGHLSFKFNGSDQLTNSVEVYTRNRGNSSAANTYAAVKFKANVARKEMCKSIVNVTGPDNANAAKTDRLWKETVKSAGHRVRAIMHGRSPLARAEQAVPFGGILQNVGDQTLIQRATYPDPEDEDRDQMLRDSGAVYGCEVFGRGCAHGSAETINANFRKSIEDMQAQLGSIFGKVYKHFQLNNNGQGYTNEAVCTSNNNDSSAHVCYDRRSQDGARSPAVASIHTADGCIPETNGDTCPMGEIGNFSVNGINSGLVFGVGSVTAITRFYAWAPADHMPIRNVIVAWGAQGAIPAGNAIGKYKNHKQVCQPEDDVATGWCSLDARGQLNHNISCTEDSECSRSGAGECVAPGAGNNAAKPLFSNKPDSCHEGYMEFAYSYNFDATDEGCGYAVDVSAPQGMSGEDIAALKRQGLESGDSYCAFKPRVVVQDNWGWCNGSCGGRANGACWGDIDEPDDEPFNKCIAPDSNPDVGTPFNGWIIVADQSD